LFAFATGALVVVLPYLFAGGAVALYVAIGLVALALFAVGAGIGVLNGRPFLRSGLRQVIAGGLAAAVVFGVGHLLGTTVS
jgi:VIT1/CCC1 family predicted Fe2+/Mn2+ transporter